MSAVRSTAKGKPRRRSAERSGRALAVGTFLAAAAATLCGCARHETEPLPHPPVTTVAEGAASRAAAIGRWKLAPPGELEHVVLWISHILIRHEGNTSRSVPFGAPGWQAEGPPPGRPREEALKLARTIVARARREPGAFGELAREYSDDRPTRDWGGSLGGVAASELRPWPEILDELSGLEPGETSEVIETDLGFEILHRRAVPDPVRVAGRRIVLGYDGTPRLRPGGRGPDRTRDEALSEAHDLVARARAGAPFASLVEQYSEDPDREQDGDIGLWSNREPTPFRRQIETLVSLEESAVSDPIDTPEGIEIVQRTDAHARASYAASFIKLWFDDGLPESNEHSRAQVMAKARTIARLVKADPSRFAAFQKEYCCARPEQWTAGRGPAGMTGVLDRLALGQIADAPFDMFPQVAVVQRLDPTTLPAPPEPTFELPNPKAPDLEYWIQRAKPEALARFVRGYASSGAELLRLDAARSKTFAELHQHLEERLIAADTGEERVQELRQSLAQIEDLLGQADFDRYLALVNARVSAVLLGRRGQRQSHGAERSQSDGT